MVSAGSPSSASALAERAQSSTQTCTRSQPPPQVAPAGLGAMTSDAMADAGDLLDVDVDELALPPTAVAIRHFPASGSLRLAGWTLLRVGGTVGRPASEAGAPRRVGVEEQPCLTLGRRISSSCGRLVRTT